MSHERVLTLVWSLWIVTLVALAFVLWVTTAQAHGPGRPDLWHDAQYVLPVGSKVTIAPACDVQELIAASRVWAEITSPGVVDGLTLGWWDADSRYWKRVIEQRWRRAVESCK